MSINTDCESWIGRTLFDVDDCRLGTIEAIYFDEQTDRPQWMVVRTGLFGTRHSFVPLVDAMAVRGDVTTPFDKRQIEHAPRLGPAADLDGDRVVELYRYYGLPYDVPDAVDRPAAGASLAERVLSYVG